MNNIIASHIHNIFLKPGEVVVARKPVLVSTVLGSCIAVTMFEPTCGVGAICHAMLPKNPGKGDILLYVDTALQEMHRKIMKYGSGNNLVVKMFGGAKVLSSTNSLSQILTVGEQNVCCAFKVLESLRLEVVAKDVGGIRGRKLYFSTVNGDVYLKRMRASEYQ